MTDYVTLCTGGYCTNLTKGSRPVDVFLMVKTPEWVAVEEVLHTR